MSKQEILEFCSKEGLLLDNGLIESFLKISSLNLIKDFLKKITSLGKKKFISIPLICSLKNPLKFYYTSLSEKDKIQLKIFFEEFSLFNDELMEEPVLDEISELSSSVKVLSSYSTLGKSLEVKDFVNFFRDRYKVYKNLLQENSTLENLSAINKIPYEKQKCSIIGMVFSKKQTKNGNLMFEVEDLTGKIKIVLSKDGKEELFKKAEEIPLDCVLGFKGFGNGEILFANDIIFPEAQLGFSRKKSNVEEYALFIGDIHYGSKNFLKADFLKFIDYLNGNFPDTPEVKKIKYLFLVGDLVTGVGNYPNQELDLEIKDLEQQFQSFAEILSKIRKDIKIIISPGNHDGVRLMEPQPFLNEKFAWPLYELENVIITENPARVKIGSNDSFEGFEVLTYHGFSYTYYANNVPRLMMMKAMNSPERIMKYLLTYRHLAPEHGSVQYFPFGKDAHFINKIPDIFVSGHTHKSGVTYFNDILIVSVSSWEGMTPYQEKFGNKPDHCKVPMINLKTRAVRILDFEIKKERENEN